VAGRVVGAAVAREGRYGISWSLSKVSFADGIKDLLLYSSFLQKGFLCIASKEALLKRVFFYGIFWAFFMRFKGYVVQVWAPKLVDGI